MCLNHMLATDMASCKYLCQPADPSTTDIRSNFALLERAVAQFDSRFALRALRSISSLRKRLTDRVLCSVIILTYSPNNATARTFIEYIGMDGEAIQSVVSQYKEEVQLNKTNAKEPIPEIDVYIAILIQVRGPRQTRRVTCGIADQRRCICTTRRSTTRAPSSRRSWWTRSGT
jgi:26S proteasome regulatory subunit N3